jgi:hypothetical protein
MTTTANAPVISTIEDGYNLMKDTISNINEHIPVLAEYAEKCCHVVELGVCDMVTTWGFLKGLRFNKKNKKNLVCVDIMEKPARFDNVVELAKKNTIGMEFLNSNSLTMTIPKTDLLFIDTVHHYAQLIRELEKHCQNVRKYIIIHNTEIDGRFGEIIRMCYYYDVDELQRKNGFKIKDMCKGLGYAIEEFLEKHKEWRVDKHLPNNNGLTILTRVE